mgnify:CR=1 FL=1
MTTREDLDQSFRQMETTEMAAMMARVDVAKRKRLGIVGAAKRDGQTAISHRHG